MNARKAAWSPEPLWTPAQLAAFLGGGYSVKTLANKRSAGKGPRFVRLEGGAVRYDPADVRAWLDEQRRAVA